MATLKDRKAKETPTATAVKTITKKEKKDKYPVNVVFDGELESAIRERARSKGIGVATYIKTLVAEDLNK